MNLVNNFDKKVQENSVNCILSDKKVALVNQKTCEQIIVASLQDQGTLEEKPDLTDDSWLVLISFFLGFIKLFDVLLM